MRALFAFFVLAFSGCSLAESHRNDVFDWVDAGMPPTFPQTYIINDQLNIEVTRLGYKNKHDYLTYMENPKGETVNVLDFIKANNSELWTELNEKLMVAEKVLLSVLIDKESVLCGPCKSQMSLLVEKNYFGMPHIKLVISG